MEDTKIIILLVDDDEDDYIITRDLISEIGKDNFILEWKSTFDSGLEAIKLNKHDVGLIDYNLGAHNGVELLRAAQENGFKGPLILLTGQNDYDIDMVAMREGASNYLVKDTIDAFTLERTIRYAIKQKKEEEKKLLKEHNYDKLTGLASLYLFKEILQNLIAGAERYNKKIAILFFDINNFKRINEAFTYAIGDRLLIMISDRLKVITRKCDFVGYKILEDNTHTLARIGGDEFVIILSNINIRNSAKVTQRIIDSISKPFFVDGNELFITSCIGISVYPNDGKDVDSLLQSANIALHNAKKDGRNKYKYYESSMNLLIKKRLVLENYLHKALNNNELKLYYQPQIDLRSMKIIGVEALLRWYHPKLGIVPPNDFIGIAEESGLIIPIGNWVIETACTQSVEWQKKGFTPMNIAVNISKIQFNDPDLLKNIQNALTKSTLPSKYLELEITESITMYNEIKIISLLQKIAKLGINISMDDFGTGYSSFSYLRDLPLNILKIDRTFINELSDDKRDLSIIKAIIAVAHNLNLKVIAEGVETENQLKILYELGCDIIQGYLLAKPQPAEEIEKYLSKKGKIIVDLSIFYKYLDKKV